MESRLSTVQGVAKRLAISQRQVWNLLSSGRMPEPIRLGRSVRWRAEDIDLWVRLGCPARDSFERERDKCPYE